MRYVGGWVWPAFKLHQMSEELGVFLGGAEAGNVPRQINHGEQRVQERNTPPMPWEQDDALRIIFGGSAVPNFIASPCVVRRAAPVPVVERKPRGLAYHPEFSAKRRRQYAKAL